MTTREIMQALLDGKKIGKTDWDLLSYVMFDGEGNLIDENGKAGVIVFMESDKLGEFFIFEERE